MYVVVNAQLFNKTLLRVVGSNLAGRENGPLAKKAFG